MTSTHPLPAPTCRDCGTTMSSDDGLAAKRCLRCRNKNRNTKRTLPPRKSLSEKLQLNKPGWRRAQARKAGTNNNATDSPSNTRTAAMAAAVLGIAIVLCCVIYIFQGNTHKSRQTPLNHTEKRLQARRQEFLELYPDLITAAGDDVQAMYMIAKEARFLNQQQAYQKVMNTILQMDPERKHPLYASTILPELGYEYLHFHTLDKDLSNIYFQVWEKKEGWYSGKNLPIISELQAEYRDWLTDPITIRKMAIRKDVATGLRMDPDAFDIGMTKHYAILLERSERYGSKLAFDQYFNMLRSLYTEFSRFYHGYLQDLTSNPPEGDTVLVFILLADKDSYQKHTAVPEFVAGHFDLASKLLVSYKGIEQKMEYQVLFHEGTHQLMDHFSTISRWEATDIKAAVYPWVNEGFAEYFGGIRRKELQFELGAPNTLRIPVIQKLLKFDRRKKLTLQSILEIDYNTLQRGGDDVQNLVYAGGWSMTYFFLTYENGKYRDDFIGFLLGCLQGLGRPEHFYDAFESYDLETLNQEWREYILSLKW